MDGPKSGLPVGGLEVLLSQVFFLGGFAFSGFFSWRFCFLMFLLLEVSLSKVFFPLEVLIFQFFFLEVLLS